MPVTVNEDALSPPATDSTGHNQYGDRLPSHAWRLTAIVVNHGMYTISRAEAQFCMGNSPTPRHRYERSLQVIFRHELDTMPSARFTQLRLEAVHDALLRLRPEDSTVTQVASDVGGFFHLGRFTRDYLAMFGEHPSATLHRPAS
jgi:AraC-like DNA-binding protein